MTAKPSIFEQLLTKGYRLLAGSSRLQTAMSMGRDVIAQDQVGDLVRISCTGGVISVGQARNATLSAAEFQVHRIHQAQ